MSTLTTGASGDHPPGVGPADHPSDAGRFLSVPRWPATAGWTVLVGVLAVLVVPPRG
ncbi:hypothetical protein [Micromonospora sp. LOL_015]|uniref:hypothetical protein n=1 Tax=Micromonospora sp. LOL_015 TaxID=3345416 RepID=UPI003A85291C